MKNIATYLILSLILFSGCNNKNSDEFEMHQSIRIAELATGKETNKFFLGFEFNDNINAYREKLDSLNDLGKIQAFRYQEGRDTIDKVKFEFKEIAELNGIDFLVHPTRHNDSLQGILLSATDKRSWTGNYNSEQFLFDELVKEYKLKYGEPNFKPKPNNLYWINGNLEINIELSEPTKIAGIDVGPKLSVTYSNTKNERRQLDKHFRNVLFLGFDTADKWYQDEKENKIKPLNDI